MLYALYNITHQQASLPLPACFKRTAVGGALLLRFRASKGALLTNSRLT